MFWNFPLDFSRINEISINLDTETDREREKKRVRWERKEDE